MSSVSLRAKSADSAHAWPCPHPSSLRKAETTAHVFYIVDAPLTWLRPCGEESDSLDPALIGCPHGLPSDRTLIGLFPEEDAIDGEGEGELPPLLSHGKAW